MQRIPLEDVYCVVIDNPCVSITTQAICALNNIGAHILICGKNHLPCCNIMSFSNYYRPLAVMKKQINWSNNWKDRIWKEIISAKITNQYNVLKLVNANKDIISQLDTYKRSVLIGDSNNREGVAAKKYFTALFGSDFIRREDCSINAALNYGYTIIRSAVAKTLVAYGFNCIIGIHHINEFNSFNLADDLMEPFRPVVDLWVDRNHESLVGELNVLQRGELVDLLNKTVSFDGKEMRIRNAIDKYICSFSTALDKDDYEYFKTPVLTQKLKKEIRDD